ncbi:hypothetical protein ZWY2020_032704 [Hordeum vulgare]|nr:hypothetical protein ZWY2020_032704 [Hordeum vulgare]
MQRKNCSASPGVGEQAVDKRGAVAGGEAGDVDLAERVVALDRAAGPGQRDYGRPEQASWRARRWGERCSAAQRSASCSSSASLHDPDREKGASAAHIAAGPPKP